MRCEDLTQELACPTGAWTPAEMAGHLADCPSCARWSRQAARFDQIWEETRPLEPSSALLDTLWASASVALETRPPLRLKGTDRRDSIRRISILAVAAAILLAVGILSTRKNSTELAQGDRPVVNPVTEPTPASQTTQIAKNSPTDETGFDAIPTFHVNDDETLLVSIPLDKNDKPKAKRLKQPWPEQSNQIPPIMPHDVIGSVETMTGTWASL
jgi:hypothetical protein